MTHSLEARVPYLDHHLVEFGARLPAHLKIKNSDRKYLLRRVAEKRLLPPEIINRAKHGFVLPLHTWMDGSLKPLINDALATLATRNLFHPRFLKKNHHATRRFALFALELWFRKYVPEFKL
jgi:asparagine synthase (glutamine-hydrolysing)